MKTYQYTLFWFRSIFECIIHYEPVLGCHSCMTGMRHMACVRSNNNKSPSQLKRIMFTVRYVIKDLFVFCIYLFKYLFIYLFIYFYLFILFIYLSLFCYWFFPYIFLFYLFVCFYYIYIYIYNPMYCIWILISSKYILLF